MSGMYAAKCFIMPSKKEPVQVMYDTSSRQKSLLHVHVTSSLIQIGFLIILWLQMLICFLCYKCCTLFGNQLVLHAHYLHDCQNRRIGRLYRNVQNRLLWKDKTCPTRTWLIMSWKAVLLLLLLIVLLLLFYCFC